MDNLIAIIKDSDIGYENIPFNNPIIRYASRGIVYNKENKIAIFNKVNKNEFKLPGGGVENGESFKEAFIREVKEETGCILSSVREIGYIEEHKSQSNFKQISKVFIGECSKQNNFLNLTEKEKEEGGTLLWMDIDKALETMKNSFDNLIGSKYENIYITKFIVTRDIKILEYYKNNKKSI
ncbi:MAG: NUDIX hydrolase [Tenericutes bacterium HGW-Tenericutes-5]|jgi:8-oxo-dGTP diphosphatase|nr:MAG: NUDIX hydrolase [Tenericutes bacterium HGW-Tenericutes-5]